MDNYCNQMLKVVVAQVCQKVGWQAIKEFPLELLSDVLDRFLSEFTRELSKYVEFSGRIEPNLEDVALVVDQMNINLHELYEFIKNVDPVTSLIETPKLPVEKLNSLNILRSGDSELIQRPSHFQEHFPSINIITNGVDKIKSESDDTDNMPDNRTQNMNSSFKLPVLFPKEESVSQRNEDDECKGVSFGNSSVQLDKFGVIRVSGALGKTANSKPPVFNVSSTKPAKIENPPAAEAMKVVLPVTEKCLTIEKPKTPPILKKSPPISSNDLPVIATNPVETIKKEKKEKKKKKMLQIQEKQQKKQLKQMQKAIAFEKTSSVFEKSYTGFQKNLPDSSNIVPSPATFQETNKVADIVSKSTETSQHSTKTSPELTHIEAKSVSIEQDTTQKISSEPDKTKLNIFKKISVKKDVHPPITILDVDSSPIDNFNLPFGTTITPAPPTESTVKEISPSKQRDVKENLKIKDSKTKEQSIGKIKEFGKTKDIQIFSTDSSTKDDLMSSFAARAMMSIIGGSKSHEEQPFKVSFF